MKSVLILGIILSCGIEVAFGAIKSTCVNVAGETRLTCSFGNAEHTLSYETIDAQSGSNRADYKRAIANSKASEFTLESIVTSFTNIEDLEIPFGNVAQLQANTASFGSGSNGLSLKKILIRNSVLASWPAQAFLRFIALEHLDLSNNQINTIDSNAADGISLLKILNLAYNQISSLPTFPATHLINLEYLNISYNAFTSLPPTIPSAAKIKTLDLSGNKISSITADYFNAFAVLEHLSLAENQITKFDDNQFNNVANLKILNIGFLQLTSFEFLKKAIRLDTLNISSTGFVQFNETSISANTDLRYLYAGNNKLKNLLTSSFIKNTKLEMLDVSGNRIEWVDRDFFERVTSLRALNFSCNKCISQNFVTKPSDISKQFEACNSSPSIIISTFITLFSMIFVKFF